MPGLSVWKWLASLIVVVLTVGCKEPLKLRLTVTPREVTVARGSSVTVNAVLETNDVPAPATTVTWASALPSIAVVDPAGDGSAQITGVSVGAVLVTVDYRKAVKTTVLVTVTAPAITGLAIDPPFATVPAGLKTQLTAVGRRADGSEEPLTSGVTWSSSSPSNATIDARGEITAVSSGSTTVMATYGELSALATVTITAPRLTALVLTPATPDVPRGATLGLTATGTFTDGSMRDVTQMVAWSSSLPVVATVSQAGIVTAEAVGTTIIAAQMSTVRAETTLRVTQPVLASIALTPVAPTLADGQVQQFVATGTFTDGATANVTAMATWSSTVPAVATVSDAAGSKGRVTAVAVGATIVRAAVGAISGETQVTVGPPVLASITVAPITTTVPLGRSQQFTATGTYSDMSTMDLTAVTTWTSSATGIATVSDAAGSKGRATTVAMGTANITARSGTISGAATMIVGPPALDSLVVLPADGALPLGAARQMRAIGTMSNGTMPDVTAAVTWSSSLPARVSISNLGVARGLAQGAVVITAQQGTIMASTSLTITPAELASIMVLPATPSVIAGQTQQFSAIGTWTALCSPRVPRSEMKSGMGNW